ncbi:hypothetical protein BLL42_27845 (plasmid) [Pseudomonas frederiksbergensis]|uniref:Uncharacterized protein n=1 Tax=Pseudomonas frederiksbergensis TaxID=104087 RepID=A0A1J0ETV4_9PSED|nr:hypothetical protein [Pseudomonas frederiksbergensis]APC19537.1 hypothetical protein BLL42_27845 [Pseudomonas frederiksbergensis]
MIKPLSFTAKDVCSALGGVCRSRVHAWVQLPPFSFMVTMERSARRFSKADLVVMAVLQTLEDQFGVKSRLLGQLSGGIHKYLAELKSVTAEEWIFIRRSDGATRLVHAHPISESGWVLDLAEERNRIDVYLGIVPPQRELPLIADMLARSQ